MRGNVRCVQAVSLIGACLKQADMYLEVPEMENLYERHGHVEPPVRQHRT